MVGQERFMFILLVEDDTSLRAALTRLLVTHGTVASFASAEEALAWPCLAEHEVDALICDVGLPGMPGDELGRRLRIVYPDLRVVSISGDASVRPTLTKPLSAAALTRALAA